MKGFKKEEKLYTISPYDFDGSLDNAIKQLEGLRVSYKKQGYQNLRVELQDEWGYYDDHSINLVIYGTKKITIKEFLTGKKQCVKSNEI